MSTDQSNIADQLPTVLTLSTELQQLITPAQAWNYHIVPKSANNGTLEFYVDETKVSDALANELEVLFGKNIVLEKLPDDTLRQALSKYYRRNENRSKAAKVSGKESKNFLNNLLREAKETGSSDIHIERYEERCRVRLRIDGLLVERYVIDPVEYPALVNKIKVEANLNIGEKRLPQDGRIFFNTGNEKIDIRVSVLPTLHGEKIVLRLLSKDATNIDIKQLGLGDRELANYLEGIKRPNGIILISGPTGSGKTTTLYATLKILNEIRTNILTIEDPIEYTLEGINQVQLKENIGLTFPSALRTFLRQDPDVIMLGEIRDNETAQMAIRAALTGHLVLSTIHTNSAWGTVSRLTDMGVPPFLLASTLNLTVAQRLLRILCPECKEQKEFSQTLYPQNYKAPEKLLTHYTPVGCEHCYYTGYKGRTAIYEVIPVDSELAVRIKNNDLSITSLLEERKISSLSDNAFELFKKGETSIDEAYPILFNNF